jgi:hypothetical protein
MFASRLLPAEFIRKSKESWLPLKFEGLKFVTYLIASFFLCEKTLVCFFKRHKLFDFFLPLYAKAY